MTDTESRLLAAGDALVRAVETLIPLSDAEGPYDEDCAEIMRLIDAWRALAREVRKGERR